MLMDLQCGGPQSPAEKSQVRLSRIEHATTLRLH